MWWNFNRQSEINICPTHLGPLHLIKEDIVEGMTVEIMQLFERIFQFTFERQDIKSCEKQSSATLTINIIENHGTHLS